MYIVYIDGVPLVNKISINYNFIIIIDLINYNRQWRYEFQINVERNNNEKLYYYIMLQYPVIILFKCFELSLKRSLLNYVLMIRI